MPAGATTGPIAVTTAVATGTSATDFTVIHPPTITSFTPTIGSTGTTVTITGANFTGVTSVSINGVAMTDFTVGSATSITFTLPAGVTTGPLW